MKLRTFVACGVAAATVLAGVGWWYVRSVRTVKTQDACAVRDFSDAATVIDAFSDSVDDYKASVAKLEQSTERLEVLSNAIRRKLFQMDSDKFRSERIRKWLRR